MQLPALIVDKQGPSSLPSPFVSGLSMNFGEPIVTPDLGLLPSPVGSLYHSPTSCVGGGHGEAEGDATATYKCPGGSAPKPASLLRHVASKALKQDMQGHSMRSLNLRDAVAQLHRSSTSPLALCDKTQELRTSNAKADVRDHETILAAVQEEPNSHSTPLPQPRIISVRETLRLQQINSPAGTAKEAAGQSSPRRSKGFVPRPVPQGDGPLFVSTSLPPSMYRSLWTYREFHVTRKLYNGYASNVVKATCLRSQEDVVLKSYNLPSLTDFLRHQVLRELAVHSRLQHPNVVQLLAAFKEGDTLTLVLEYVRGGSLGRARRKLGGRLSEPQAVELVLRPLLGALRYLHTQSIVHRDIKPENLLFTPDWHLKVCDYGVSISLLEERAVTRTGSREYMAPEVHVCPLKRTPEDNKDNEALSYGASVDIWSLGALTYELLVGFTPFPGGPQALLPRSGAAAGGPGGSGAIAGAVAASASGGGTAQQARLLPFPGSVSPAAREFVRACLALNPADRPTVLELLRHPLIRGPPQC